MCFEVSFETLRRYAAEHGSSLETLTEVFGCGRGCGLCRPYIEAMLRTGRTSFELNDAELRRGGRGGPDV